MRSTLSLVGILLIIAGIVFFAYRGFTYTSQEKVMQIGDVNITAPQQHTVYFPPVLGGASIVVGIVLIVIARKN